MAPLLKLRGGAFFVGSVDMNAKKFLCFDLDGTLIDSRDDIAAAINHSLAHYGLPLISEKRIAEIVGHGIFRTAERALSEVSASWVDREEAGRLAADYYMRHPVVRTTLYPGVREGLERLFESGFCMGLFTNKIQPLTERVLEILGIRRFFGFVVGAEGGFPMKPDPAGLLHMLERSGCGAGDSFMIGDGAVDLETGRRAGIKTALVTYGYRDSRSLESDLRADSFSELVCSLLGSGLSRS